MGLNRLKKWLPLLLVILVAVVIAVQNIDLKTFYTGWDNVHAEFNLPEYAKRVFFGAWLEYQGMGGAAAQGHLAEIPRLPIVYLLSLVAPMNLNRYLFIFLMFLTGGIGMYTYLKRIWLTKLADPLRSWITSLSAIYYLLNILTLQQFYISFEMFTVQFAFLPFLLLSIHFLAERVSAKSILVFMTVQFLIAPSAHTPTVFYLGAFFSLLYAFFLNIQIEKNVIMAIKKALFLGFLTFFFNSYWILPNLYYLLHDSVYVIQSRANQLFAPESLWSIRDSGDIGSFFTGIHYIFGWIDFDFRKLQHVFIFDSWIKHLFTNFSLVLLIILNSFSFVGVFITIFDQKKGTKRWGMIIIYVLAAVFIWMGFFLPSRIIDFLYRFKTFQEIFRNPFTKLSILYSFVLVVFFSQFYERLIRELKRKYTVRTQKVLISIIVIGSLLSIFFASFPSFTGRFINEKLKIAYPSEYFQMFEFLKKKPDDLRVLELPYFNHEGWVYYNWSTKEKKQGYQGIGFYFFGFPQAHITPDFARWTETSDFFYHELQHALDSKSALQLKKILEKYRVNLVIVDETALSQYQREYNYQELHELLTQMGLVKIWHKNFLSIYEVSKNSAANKLIIPQKITLVNAQLNRVRRDYVYETYGEYINASSNKADIIFPFSELTMPYLNNIIFAHNKASIEKKIPAGTYSITIPGLQNQTYSTNAAFTYKDGSLFVEFPQTKIIINQREVILPQFENVSFPVDPNYDSMIVWLNDQSFRIKKNQSLFSLLTLDSSQPLEISTAGIIDSQSNDSFFAPLDLKIITLQNSLTGIFHKNTYIDQIRVERIKVESDFPSISADLTKYPSENCSSPLLGNIATELKKDKVTYKADKYGVNCNHYLFDSLSLNNSYLMKIKGNNTEGRSTKFFFNTNQTNPVQEQFLMPEGAFDKTIGLVTLGLPAKSTYKINWETRSFGNLSKNELTEMKIMPFPLDRVSQISLKKTGTQTNKNDMRLVTEKSYFNFLYIVESTCKNSSCYVGINQSYDDLWVAFDRNMSLLPHFRYNNWANVWKMNQSGKIIIVYIPQVISLFCIFLILTASGALVLVNLRLVWYTIGL